MTGTSMRVRPMGSVTRDKVFVLEAYIVQRVEYTAETAERDDTAPDTIELDDSEKCTDNQANVMEIETRGRYNHNPIICGTYDSA